MTTWTPPTNLPIAEDTVTGPTSWSPVDLTAVLDGTRTRIVPEIGSRDDGVAMFYPGRSHSVVAESEGGKTWLALAVAVTEIRAGYDVIYLDFEDSEHGITDRLLTLGAEPDLILKHFRYIRPEEPLTTSDRIRLLQLAMTARSAWIDGVTEAMALQGLDPAELKDIPVFSNTLVTPLCRTGAAVVALDHVVKDAMARGRYGIGSVHKLNAVTGAQYLLSNRQPFGIGCEGVSTIRIAKDRPGQLRRYSVDGKDGLMWFGDLVINSHDESFAELSIRSPRDGTDSQFRPTALMHKYAEYICEHPGLSKRALLGAVKGKTDYKILALELLQREGYVRVEGGDKPGVAQAFFSGRPFTEGA